MRSALAGLALAALAGCDQLAELLPREVVDGGALSGGGVNDQRIDDVPSAEPGDARSQWRAAGERTRAVTGNLTVSLPQGRAGPLVLAFGNGLTYELQQLGVQDGADGVGGEDGSFASALGADPRAGVYVYRVLNERVDAVAPEGGLCGEDRRASFVSIMEYVTAEGEWTFRVGGFAGAAPPGPGGGDPEFCEAYVYGLG